jgi:hypothetical protein
VDNGRREWEKERWKKIHSIFRGSAIIHFSSFPSGIWQTFTHNGKESLMLTEKESSLTIWWTLLYILLFVAFDRSFARETERNRYRERERAE